MEMGESHEVGEDLNWKRNLIVLWCCVFLVCASYTMVIPFLPLFLLKELQLPVGVAKMWSGGIIAITFVVAGIMAPFWGARGDVIGQKKNALRAGWCVSFLDRTAVNLVLCTAIGDKWTE